MVKRGGFLAATYIIILMIQGGIRSAIRVSLVGLHCSDVFFLKDMEEY